MVLVWQIIDDSPNSPMFAPAKVSLYMVQHYLPKVIIQEFNIIILCVSLVRRLLLSLANLVTYIQNLIDTTVCVQYLRHNGSYVQ